MVCYCIIELVTELLQSKNKDYMKMMIENDNRKGMPYKATRRGLTDFGAKTINNF